MTDVAQKAPALEAKPPESYITYRRHVCGCGETFEQQAVKAPLMARPFGWSPCRCARCQTTLEVEQRRRIEERHAMVAGERRREALKALAVPPLYADVTLAGFEPHGSAEDQAKLMRIRDLAIDYASQWPRIDEAQELLLFQGTYGSGKGHIAWSIAQAVVLAHAAQVRVVKLAAVIRDLREAWRDPDGPSEDQRLARYRQLDLLVIDEISRHAFYGKEVKQHLYDIIDDRVEQHQPTILTTNETDEGIAEILGGALWSRLNGAGGVLQFPGVDWRSRQRRG